MSNKDLIIIVVTFLVAGFSLYRKYLKKKNAGTVPGSGSKPNTTFASSSKDDDYEPYSKK